MSDVTGTWKLVSVENVKEYCEAIGTQSEFLEKALQFLTSNNDITQTICCHDNGVSITTQMPGKTTEVKADYGQPVETEFLDGRVIKIIFRMDGNILREEQSGPFTSKNVRYVDNGQLVYKMTSGDVTTTRKYQRL